MVSVAGNFYSVPDTPRHRILDVHVFADEIRIFENAVGRERQRFEMRLFLGEGFVDDAPGGRVDPGPAASAVKSLP